MYWQFMRETEKCAAYQKQIYRDLDSIPELVRKLFIKKQRYLVCRQQFTKL